MLKPTPHFESFDRMSKQLISLGAAAIRVSNFCLSIGNSNALLDQSGPDWRVGGGRANAGLGMDRTSTSGISASRGARSIKVRSHFLRIPDSGPSAALRSCRRIRLDTGVRGCGRLGRGRYCDHAATATVTAGGRRPAARAVGAGSARPLSRHVFRSGRGCRGWPAVLRRWRRCAPRRRNGRRCSRRYQIRA